MTTVADRFWDNVRGGDVTECWEWTRTRNSKGYGLVAVSIDGRRTTRRAHRMAYEHLIGPIPAGLETDHLCLNTGCVNPWHLDLVTKVVNVLRGHASRRMRPEPDFCRRGHPWTPENTYRWVTRSGTPCRKCRECAREKASAAVAA